MDTVNRVQVLNETVCISYRANTLGKIYLASHPGLAVRWLYIYVYIYGRYSEMYGRQYRVRSGIIIVKP